MPEIWFAFNENIQTVFSAGRFAFEVEPKSNQMKICQDLVDQFVLIAISGEFWIKADKKKQSQMFYHFFHSTFKGY